jgi:hypothetical protein
MAGMHTLLPAARSLAAELGLLDTTVFFGDWVAYVDWSNVLCECDAALTLHQASLETRLAFRSRVLEYFWAGLPVVATAGDATADLVAHYDVGILTPPGDVEAVAGAILALVDDTTGKRAGQFARARAELNWERAAAPLLAFCREPHRAADKGMGGWMPPQPDPDAIPRLESEIRDLRVLVQGYEQGRVMRALRGVDQIKRRWQRGQP